jgi:LPXTG-motif cell wall-anchored protein
MNNATGTAKDRDRKDRGARNNAEAAPVEGYAAGDGYVPPAEGAYLPSGEEGYAEPVPAVGESVDSSSEQVLKLPSTGAGIETSMPVAAATGLVALALGALGLRRRRLA